MIDYQGDVGTALKSGDPTDLQKLYEALRLEMIYHYPYTSCCPEHSRSTDLVGVSDLGPAGCHR